MFACPARLTVHLFSVIVKSQPTPTLYCCDSHCKSINMPVPFEALLPLGIIATLTGVSGIGMRWVKQRYEDGKRPRYNLDAWDKWMMDRDRRLTGRERGQQSDPVAPPGFATSSVWYMEKISPFQTRQ
jgi:hypothetical protein